MFGIYRNLGPSLAGLLLAASLSASAALAQQNSDGEDNDEATDPDVLYLQENAKRDGIIIRPSGLQIRIIKRGDGDLPDPTSMVAVHYEGRLVDGTIFDSSYARGEPAEFPVNGVIKGWTEALILMQVGSEWEIVMPASIAYGDEGTGQTIGPGATLIFKVELLSVD